jgi:predicted nucleotidyltransferase component of viral defense system
MLQSVCNTITGKVGILFSKVKIGPINWENNQVGYETKIKFWGANHKRNQQPPAAQRWQTEIKIEIVHYEKLVNSPVNKPLLSIYSDSGLFALQTIPCYQLVEIMGEKLRALLQRSYPAPRDYYDIWKLSQQPEVLKNWDLIVETFLQKASFKHITFNDYSDLFNIERINKMKKEWNNSLRGHLREEDFPDVNQVINELETVFHRMK